MKRILTICLLLALTPFASLAQLPPPVPPSPPQVPPPPPPPPAALGKWWKNAQIVRTLELSDAQVAQIEEVYVQHQPRLSSLRSALLQEEERMRALLESDRLDERAIPAQTQAVAGARAALTAENAEMSLGMRRVMTSGQWRKLEQLRQAPGVPPAPPIPASPPLPPDISGQEVFDTSTPGLKQPEPVAKPLPPYTPEARDAKIEGLVLLQAVIRKDGSVSDVKLLRSPGYGLGESAAECVTTGWRFRPGTLNGEAVNVRVNLEISFRLQKEPEPT